MPLIIRFRQFPSEFPRPSYPDRLNIFWEMTEAEDWGLPTAGESVRLEQFENRLVEAVEVDAHSVLSVVLTTAGTREFVLHTADSGGFAQRLGCIPQEADRYPIKILRTVDIRWEYDASVTPDANLPRT